MEFKNLESDSLLIRKFSNSDVSALFRLSQEKSLGEWIPDQVYQNEAEAANVVKFLTSQYEFSIDPARRPLVLGIVLKRNELLIGHVGLSPLGDGEIEIGYAIGEDYQGKGYATQAVRVISHWAMSNLNIPKINGIVVCENAGSGRVLEKAGFDLEVESNRNYLGKVRLCRRYSFSKLSSL